LKIGSTSVSTTTVTIKKLHFNQGNIPYLFDYNAQNFELIFRQKSMLRVIHECGFKHLKRACARACTFQCGTISCKHTHMRQLSVHLTFPLRWEYLFAIIVLYCRYPLYIIYYGKTKTFLSCYLMCLPVVSREKNKKKNFIPIFIQNLRVRVIHKCAL